MTTTELDYRVGTLVITDAELLVRPLRLNANHYNLLDLGNRGGHILFKGDPSAAHQLLGPAFKAYVDICSREMRCHADARVSYVVDGVTAQCVLYGLDGSSTRGKYTMIFDVYCNVAKEETEEFLASLTTNLETDCFIVVRPDESCELGFAVSL